MTIAPKHQPRIQQSRNTMAKKTDKKKPVTSAPKPKAAPKKSPTLSGTKRKAVWAKFTTALLRHPPGGGPMLAAAAPAPAAAPQDRDTIRHGGVRLAIIGAGAPENFSSTATLDNLHVAPEVVKANLETIFPCSISVKKDDTENTLAEKLRLKGC